ncbi:hypothetical protein I3843_07G169200 [Carya illinoinensis]|uniref:Uncharacterized protein n=1 Tax=Carya illinoinensis TaxID=32201 RepID=A0A922EKF0_CARIL|nr:hypothetical protein I3760_07G169300 [Carya illinoinensis]KAG6705343.1 hypothetical protein I3842_07G174300 [Carya illinoinensis]KAG7972159.1 hypothetical protein I3843_07G169200 [Carya illinoinensis]
MMNHSKAQPRAGSTVPFSWERKPGVSKVTHQDQCPTEGDMVRIKLPPPPCPSEAARVSAHDFQILPLPPCPFQPAPSRSSSKKGLKREDPFLAAYKECTKSINGNGKSPKNGVNLYSGFGKITMPDFSCRRSCSVRDGNLVRISRLPCEREREK